MLGKVVRILAVAAWIVAASVLPFVLPPQASAATVSGSLASPGTGGDCPSSWPGVSGGGTNRCRILVASLNPGDGQIVSWSLSGAGGATSTGLTCGGTSLYGHATVSGAGTFTATPPDGASSCAILVMNDNGYSYLSNPTGGTYTYDDADVPAPTPTPTPTPSPTPTPAPSGGPVASPWPVTQPDGTEPDVTPAGCSYGSGFICTYSASNIGKIGTERACYETLTSAYATAAMNPDGWRLSCAAGYPQNSTNLGGSLALDSGDPVGAAIGTYYMGEANNARSLRVMASSGVVGGGFWTCEPEEDGEGLLSDDWCRAFGRLGAIQVLARPTGTSDVFAINPTNRTTFRGGQPGNNDGNARGAWYCEPAYVYPDFAAVPGCGTGAMDYPSEFAFDLPDGFDGRLYLRLVTQESTQLAPGATTSQRMQAAPLYAFLPYGYWTPALISGDGEPPAWQVCLGAFGPEDPVAGAGDCGSASAEFDDLEWATCDDDPDPGVDCDYGGLPTCNPAEGVEPGDFSCGAPSGGGFGGGGSANGGGASCDIETGVCIVRTFCAGPGMALDLLGWVSYGVCLVEQIPSAFGGLLTALFVPSERSADAWGDVITSANTKVPFAWYAEITGTISDSSGAAASEDFGALSFEIAGTDIPVGDAFDDAVGALAPYRGLFFAGMAMLMIFGCMRWIMAAVGVSPGGGSTPE